MFHVGVEGGKKPQQVREINQKKKSGAVGLDNIWKDNGY